MSFLSKKYFVLMFLLSKNNFVLLSIIVLLSSCMSTKKVTYFQDKESVDAALSKGLYDAKIMPKDVLQIQAFIDWLDR